MKSAAIACLLFWIGAPPPTLAQDSFADAFIRGAQAGAAIRQSQALRQYYAQQTQLVEAQTRAIEAQIKQLEDAEKRAQEAKVKAQANSPEAQAAIAKEVEVLLGVFTVIHPDWKQFEAPMIAFGQKVVPAGNTTGIEYLEILYTLAKAKATPKPAS